MLLPNYARFNLFYWAKQRFDPFDPLTGNQAIEGRSTAGTPGPPRQMSTLASIGVLPNLLASSPLPWQPGSFVHLDSNVTGASDTATAQWFHDGHPLEGGAVNGLDLGPLFLADYGYYSVVITDGTQTLIVKSCFVSVLTASPESHPPEPAISETERDSEDAGLQILPSDQDAADW